MAEDRTDEGGSTAAFRTLTDFRYDERADLYRARYDPCSASDFVVDLVFAVSNVLGVPTDELEPAYHAVDLTLLEALAGASPDAAWSAGPVVFAVNDCLVTVGDEEVTFEPSGT